jgi:GYF domain 2
MWDCSVQRLALGFGHPLNRRICMTIDFKRALLVAGLGLGLTLSAPLAAQTTTDTTTTEPAAEPATADTPPALPPALPAAPDPATPPPLPPQPDFYIDENGTPGGPYKLAQLQALVTAGTLKPATLAWTDGMAEWAAASTVAGLEPLFAAASPGPTPTPTPDAPAVDLATFVVGNWQQTGPIDIPGVGPGTADLAASFAPDGSFTMSGTIEATNAETGTMTIQVEGQGTYVAQPMGADLFAVTQTGSAKMTIPGFAPVEQALAETTNYRMIDANTIEDTVTGDRLVRQP